MCGMMNHNAYEIPNAHYDHVEPILGIYSNHSLTDHTVYPDDILVHTSNIGIDGKSNFGYFRRFDSLFDSVKFDGNCSIVPYGLIPNLFYPCIERTWTFGSAIIGL
jgi:hypothetical protein